LNGVALSGDYSRRKEHVEKVIQGINSIRFDYEVVAHGSTVSLVLIRN